MTEEKKCPLYKKCGGCQLQNLSYAEQLGFKQRKTERLLGEFGPQQGSGGVCHGEKRKDNFRSLSVRHAQHSLRRFMPDGGQKSG